MARRNNRVEVERARKPDSGPVQLSGYMTFAPQSSRNRLRNKTWRSGLPSDLIQGEGLSDFYIDDSSPIELADTPLTTGLRGGGAATQALPQPSQLRKTPLALPKIQTNFTDPEGTVSMTSSNEQRKRSPSEDSDNISPTNTRPHAVENYSRLFGQLPDIIRLQEQTGDFDGQIVFIGHPNRDVSAHQWLSESYQWVNIGLWSHTRKRIEGSIASDRITTSGFSYNSIEYFKFVAEHRESTYKEQGHPQTGPETDLTGPTPTEIGSENEGKVPVPSSTPAPVFRTVTGEKLEDPFVVPAAHSQPSSKVAFTFGGGCGNVGSMDFNYEFPSKPSATTKDHQKIYVQRERERLEALREQSMTQREAQTPLREIEFGEEAATGFTPPAARKLPVRQDTVLSSEDLHNRLQARTRLSELAQATRRSGLTPEQRVAVPDFPMNVNPRNPIPAGPTVANPFRGTSTLNAAAAPYRMPDKAPPPASSVSTAAVPHLPASTSDLTLRFSDPDGVLQEPVHPIVNGFNKQAPTRQNWNGPFFADSIPTAHDPLASLTVQTSSEQKLVDWYSDGQNLLRQQDFAKTLVAAVPESSKTQSFGVIGETFARQDMLRFANTHLFARVHEHLYEYAEEARAGGGSDYFTRAWKPAPPRLRDIGPNGNNSFYSSASTISPQCSRAASRLYQPFRGDSGPWGFGLAASSPFPSQYGSSPTVSRMYGAPGNRGF